MYLCAKGIEFASSYNFSMGLKNCSDNMALFVFYIVRTVPKSNRKMKKKQYCNTVGTFPKSNRKTNNSTLSEQFESPIDIQIIPHCRLELF
jgi:hypothetical protein